MANLYVNVWPDAKETALGTMEAVLKITTLSGSNQVTSAVAENGTTKIKRVRIYAEANAFIAMGANPDATEAAQQIPIGADNPEYFTVPLGTKFAGITR